MIVTATVSFAGTITMAKGEKRDIPNGDILSDLLKAGYVSVDETAKEVKSVEIKRNISRRSKADIKD